MYLVEVHHSNMVSSSFSVQWFWCAHPISGKISSQLSTRKSCNTQKLQGADVNSVNQPFERLAMSFWRGHRSHTTPQHEKIMPIMHDCNQQNFSEQSTMDVADCWVCRLLGSRLKIFPFAERYMLSKQFTVVNNESCDVQKLLPKSIYMDALATLMSMRWCDYWWPSFST